MYCTALSCELLYAVCTVFMHYKYTPVINSISKPKAGSDHENKSLISQFLISCYIRNFKSTLISVIILGNTKIIVALYCLLVKKWRSHLQQSSFNVQFASNFCDKAVERDCCHQLFCEECIKPVNGCPTCRHSPLRVQSSNLSRRS